VLKDTYASEIQAVLAHYPPDQKRSAAMPLLYLAQKAYGHISPAAVDEVAELIGASSAQVGSLVGFYSLYHDHPGGKTRVQVCVDLPCALSGGEKLAEVLCANLGIRLGETTPDGAITVEGVMCLAGCDKAPVIQAQDADGIHYHENQTAETAMAWIEHARREPADG
jgi:NADH-quinone oxidoreductase subunit E